MATRTVMNKKLQRLKYLILDSSLDKGIVMSDEEYTVDFLLEGLSKDQRLSDVEKCETLFDELLAKVPPGSDGLMLQPYWSPSNGDGPETRGAIIGFNEDHTR